MNLTRITCCRAASSHWTHPGLQSGGGLKLRPSSERRRSATCGQWTIQPLNAAGDVGTQDVGDCRQPEMLGGHSEGQRCAITAQTSLRHGHPFGGPVRGRGRVRTVSSHLHPLDAGHALMRAKAAEVPGKRFQKNGLTPQFTRMEAGCTDQATSRETKEQIGRRTERGQKERRWRGGWSRAPAAIPESW